MHILFYRCVFTCVQVSSFSNCQTYSKILSKIRLLAQVSVSYSWWCPAGLFALISVLSVAAPDLCVAPPLPAWLQQPSVMPRRQLATNRPLNQPLKSNIKNPTTVAMVWMENQLLRWKNCFLPGYKHVYFCLKVGALNMVVHVDCLTF